MHRFGTQNMMRASLAFYNTIAEIDTLIESLKKVQKMFS